MIGKRKKTKSITGTKGTCAVSSQCLSSLSLGVSSDSSTTSSYILDIDLSSLRTRDEMSGKEVCQYLRDKYTRYLKNISHVGDVSLREDLIPSTREYKIPSSLTRRDMDIIGLKEKDIANVLILLPILYSITTFKAAINRKTKKNGGLPFAHIHSSILSRFILTLAERTPGFLSILENTKWIEIDHSYKIGERSKQYRIGPKFRNDEWVKADWKETLEKFLPEIMDRMSYVSRKKKIIYDLWNRASFYFMDWRDMPEGNFKEICRKTDAIGRRLSVNHSRGGLEAAITQAAARQVEEQIQTEGRAASTVDELIVQYREDLELFNGKGFYVILHDERYKLPTYRLFTPFTNLKKELRPYVQLDGRDLVNVDIRSCQVALLATFYGESEEEQKEKEYFKSLICGQDIYLFLAGENQSRGDAKLMMFRVMFDRTICQRGPIYEKFQKEFPILSRKIAEAKVGNYKNAAYLMQKQEADIMIFGALNYLLFRRGIDCLSIHDSISCRAEHVEEVKQVITSFFSDKMGFCPEVRVD